MKSSPTGAVRIACSRRTTCCGEARLVRVRPEPSTAWTAVPLEAANCSTTVAPAAVVPPLPNSAPSSFSSISAKKLSESTSVVLTRALIVGEWTTAIVVDASSSALPIATPCATRTPEARSEESSFEAATMAGSAAKLPAAAEL